MAMDDLGLFVRFEQELHRRPAKERKPFSIVVVAIKDAPVEEVAIQMRLDKEALQPVHPPKIHVAMDPMLVVRHPQVAIGLGETGNSVITHAVVFGQDDLYCISADLQFLRQPVHDVGQPADFGCRRALRCDHYDKHRNKITLKSLPFRHELYKVLPELKAPNPSSDNKMREYLLFFKPRIARITPIWISDSCSMDNPQTFCLAAARSKRAQFHGGSDGDFDPTGPYPLHLYWSSVCNFWLV